MTTRVFSSDGWCPLSVHASLGTATGGYGGIRLVHSMRADGFVCPQCYCKCSTWRANCHACTAPTPDMESNDLPSSAALAMEQARLFAREDASMIARKKADAKIMSELRARNDNQPKEKKRIPNKVKVKLEGKSDEA